MYFGIVQSLIIIFGYGPIKNTHHKRKKLNFEGPHN